jgi:hypothetical protein
MKIRLLKKWDWVHRTFPRGTILEVVDGLAKKMINAKTAEEYTGVYPPKGKVKTDLFKPKKIENGKSEGE